MTQPRVPASLAVEVEQFEVRRRAALYVAAFLVPAVLAVVLGWLAWSQGEVVWAGVAGLLALTALTAMPGLRDLGTPLFVADAHGVRMRSGRLWVGLLWSEMAGIHVEGRSGRHDPCIKVVSPDGSRVYRSPVGITTTVSVAEAEDQLARVLDAVAY
ncbi:hypothetical protein GCM10009821_19720 [Aeromicrobium halocynthiae]|uniref:PH domain-containing protein n=1 Tax=Aeromicrobium halocynthiae TaxID=560557 RepID=A0ABN2W1L0_9ACTN